MLYPPEPFFCSPPFPHHDPPGRWGRCRRRRMFSTAYLVLSLQAGIHYDSCRRRMHQENLGKS